MKPLSVCLIVKDCATILRDCLESVKPMLTVEGDELVIVDTGSTDDTCLVAEQYGARVFKHPELRQAGMLERVKEWLPQFHEQYAADPRSADGFLSSFEAARNLSFEHAQNDLLMWIDADDILVGGAALREVADRFMEDPAKDAVFLQYDYSFSEDGSCNTVQWRERLVRKGRFRWKGLCHETLIPQGDKPLNVAKVDPNLARIVHKHGRHHILSDVRNYVILRSDYEAATWKDPRTEYYLGNACRGLAGKTPGSPLFQECLEWYSRALRRSGSRDDRASMLINIAAIHMIHGRYWKAIDIFHQASKIFPEDPRPFFGIAHANFELRRYPVCIQYVQLGRSLGTAALESTFHSVDPLQITFQPALFECMAWLKLNRYQEALQCAAALQEMRPNHPAVTNLRREIETEAQRAQLTSTVMGTLNLSFSPTAAREILHRLKPEIRRDVPALQVEVMAPPQEKTITWLCGKTHEPWDATSLETTGIGGSEQMVVRLSQEWARRGWLVDVYGHPTAGQAYKDQEGVFYRPAESFNPELPRNIIILWRNPSPADSAGLRGKLFVDMHDVSSDAAFTPSRVKRIDKVIFKSQFHAAYVPSLPAEKRFVSRNGIHLPALKPQPLGERNLNKIIWTSSGDRGLLGALRAYALAKRKNPALEFVAAYGFTPLYCEKAASQEYQFMGDEGCERHMLDYQEECFAAADQFGAKILGRVSHSRLMEELGSSNIWLYPTTFPEISCISAMEAQASGAIPICSKTGALAETVDWGTFVEPNNAFEIVCAIQRLLDMPEKTREEHRAQMMADARTRFDISPLAEAWLKEFSK